MKQVIQWTVAALIAFLFTAPTYAVDIGVPPDGTAIAVTTATPNQMLPATEIPPMAPEVRLAEIVVATTISDNNQVNVQVHRALGASAVNVASADNNIIGETDIGNVVSQTTRTDNAAAQAYDFVPEVTARKTQAVIVAMMNYAFDDITTQTMNVNAANTLQLSEVAPRQVQAVTFVVTMNRRYR